MAKATDLETIERVEVLRRLYLEGNDMSYMLQYIADKWQVNERMARYYMSRVKAAVLKELKATNAQALAEHLAFRRMLRLKALDSKNPKLALEAAVDEAKLRGLYKTSLAVLEVNMKDLTDEQLERISKGESLTDVLGTQ